MKRYKNWWEAPYEKTSGYGKHFLVRLKIIYERRILCPVCARAEARKK
jgi:hypothetical protein